jgi:hypothetical protein
LHWLDTFSAASSPIVAILTHHSAFQRTDLGGARVADLRILIFKQVLVGHLATYSGWKHLQELRYVSFPLAALPHSFSDIASVMESTPQEIVSV